MTIHVLASGSSGNALCIQEGDCAYLVDAGISYKRMRELLPVPVEQVKGILITHYHSDHSQSIRKWLVEHDLPVWCTEAAKRPRETSEAERDEDGTIVIKAQHQTPLAVALEKFPEAWREVPLRKPFDLLCGWKALALPSVHQSAGAVCYTLKSPSGAKLSMLTETGAVTAEMARATKGAWCVMLESNYNPVTIAVDIIRPQRVNDRAYNGHLGNDQVARLIPYLPDSVRALILGHISQTVNDPVDVRIFAEEANAKRSRPLDLYIAGDEVLTVEESSAASAEETPND